MKKTKMEIDTLVDNIINSSGIKESQSTPIMLELERACMKIILASVAMDTDDINIKTVMKSIPNSISESYKLLEKIKDENQEDAIEKVRACHEKTLYNTYTSIKIIFYVYFMEQYITCKK